METVHYILCAPLSTSGAEGKRGAVADAQGLIITISIMMILLLLQIIIVPITTLFIIIISIIISSIMLIDSIIIVIISIINAHRRYSRRVSQRLRAGRGGDENPVRQGTARSDYTTLHYTTLHFTSLYYAMLCHNTLYNNIHHLAINEHTVTLDYIISHRIARAIQVGSMLEYLEQHLNHA